MLGPQWAVSSERTIFLRCHSRNFIFPIFDDVGAWELSLFSPLGVLSVVQCLVVDSHGPSRNLTIVGPTALSPSSESAPCHGQCASAHCLTCASVVQCPAAVECGGPYSIHVALVLVHASTLNSFPLGYCAPFITSIYTLPRFLHGSPSDEYEFSSLLSRRKQCPRPLRAIIQFSALRRKCGAACFRATSLQWAWWCCCTIVSSLSTTRCGLNLSYFWASISRFSQSRLVWPGGLSFPKILYYINRYLSAIAIIFCIYREYYDCVGKLNRTLKDDR